MCWVQVVTAVDEDARSWHTLSFIIEIRLAGHIWAGAVLGGVGQQVAAPVKKVQEGNLQAGRRVRAVLEPPVLLIPVPARRQFNGGARGQFKHEVPDFTPVDVAVLELI